MADFGSVSNVIKPKRTSSLNASSTPSEAWPKVQLASVLLYGWYLITPLCQSTGFMASVPGPATQSLLTGR